MKIPDIQEAIDDALAKRGLDQYVDYATYLPQDAPAPTDATHIVSVRSASDPTRKVEIAVKAHGFYAAIADIALGTL